MGYACRHHPFARAGPAAAALPRPWLVLLLASCCAAAWTKRSSSLVEVEPAESAESAAEDLEQPRSSLVEMGSTKLAESATSAEDLEQSRSSLVEVESAKPAESAKSAEDLEQPRSSLLEVESAEPAESAMSAEDLELSRSSLLEVESAEPAESATSAEDLEQPRSSLAEVEAAEPAESAERLEQPRSSLLVESTESAESTEGLEQPPGSSLVEVDPAGSVVPIRRPTPPTTPRPGVLKRIRNFFSYKWRQRTGDGVTELYFPPNKVVRKRAASNVRGAYDCQILLDQDSVFWFLKGLEDEKPFYHRRGDQTRISMADSNRLGSWDAQGVENEGAIFNCLKDPPRCEFPYMPTNLHLKRAATELERAWSARVIVNQLAIYQLIQCTLGPCGVVPVMSLPFPPDEAIQKRAYENKRGMFDAQQIMNQKAIWARALEWSEKVRAQGTAAAAERT